MRKVWRGYHQFESIVEIFEIIQEYKVERLALCTCQVKIDLPRRFTKSGIEELSIKECRDPRRPPEKAVNFCVNNLQSKQN